MDEVLLESVLVCLYAVCGFASQETMPADTEEVLGVAMVATLPEKLSTGPLMGMRFHAKIDDFIELLQVYPTSESRQ